jgi:hypothetical protein
MRTLCLLTVLVGGCGTLRFVDRDVVWREHDDRPIKKPRERETLVNWASARNMVFMPIDRGLALDYGHEADDVNAFDEVPESSWYSDPRRDPAHPYARPRTLGPERMTWGPASAEDIPVPPLVLTKPKAIGASPGFVVEDSRKVRYLIKLDPEGHSNFATSTELVVSRLAWASGWRVPKEVMFSFYPNEISIGPKAATKDIFNDKHRFGDPQLAKLMAKVARQPDGSILALASRWLPGEPIGCFTFDGLRKDDPNDRIPHQNRRSLRGFGTFGAWVNNIDALENNNLDMWNGYVIHYQQDVGGSFGVWAAQPAAYWMGHESYFSFGSLLASLFSFGIYTPEWYDERYRKLYEERVREWPELGGFSADHFNPRTWKPTVAHPGFVRQTERDRYWAAKRLAAFTEEEVRAAVAAGQYRRAAAERLFEILWKRRERILREYLKVSSALDYFRFEDERLCFDDVWLTAGLGGVPRYSAREARASLTVVRGADGTACVSPGAGRGYRVVTLDVAREGDKHPAPPVKVHFTAGRILGIER